MMDRKSRYNNLDNSKIVFMTPDELDTLDIGFDTTEYTEKERKMHFPILYDALIEMIKETTIGATNGSELHIPVEDAEDCYACVCIKVGDKYIPMQSEEYEQGGITKIKQVKMFQRLISENKISSEDLAMADVSTEVYKKIVSNELAGIQIYNKKKEYIDNLLASQQKEPMFEELRNRVLEN